MINHHYGFGLVDADHASTLAKDWVNYPEERVIEKQSDVSMAIPDDDALGVTASIFVAEDIVIEFIDIVFDAPEHPRLGDLEVLLISPAGTQSVLAEPHHELFDGAFRYKNWRFGSMRHLEERSRGEWKLIVMDKAAGSTGNFNSWKLILYGHSPIVTCGLNKSDWKPNAFVAETTDSLNTRNAGVSPF
jgi:subtilisin-like proprotein convertase family protein